MLALRQNFAGEGNATWCIAEANKIKVMLHYWHESTLPFTKFLDAFQKMCTIYEEEGEPLVDKSKVREILQICL